MNNYIRITGTGSSVPDNILTNADLEQMVDASDALITECSGIKERRISQVDKFDAGFTCGSVLIEWYG